MKVTMTRRFRWVALPSLLAGLALGACDQPPVPFPQPNPHQGPDCGMMVFFDTNSSALSSQATNTLNNFLKYCATVKDGVAVFTTFVSGHTDTTGAPQANFVLSLARAQSVRGYLVSHGLPADSIDVRTYGDTKPLVSGSGEPTDRQNRRVELGILSKRKP